MPPTATCDSRYGAGDAKPMQRGAASRSPQPQRPDLAVNRSARPKASADQRSPLVARAPPATAAGPCPDAKALAIVPTETQCGPFCAEDDALAVHTGQAASSDSLAPQEGAERELGCDDRSAAACFFDGSSVSDLLLEGGAIVKLPMRDLPPFLEDFPHAFERLPYLSKMRMVQVLSKFLSGPRPDAMPWGSVSLEVRQAVVIDRSGRRVLRKSLAINNKLECSEEREIRDGG